MVVGTPGGTTIPTSVFQAIVGVIDFGMSGTEAVMQPKFHHEWLPDILGIGKFNTDTIAALQKMGYKTGFGGYSSLELIKKVEPEVYELVSQKGSAEGY